MGEELTLFRVGARYRARQSFRAPRDQFEAGEELIYWRHAVSIYDGMKGWFFFRRDGASPTIRSWDMEIGTEPGADCFELVAEPDPLVTAAASGNCDALALGLELDRGEFDEVIVRLAIDEAIAAGHLDAVLFVLEQCPEAREPHSRPLRHAVLCRQVAIASALVERGMDPDAAPSNGQSARTVATMREDNDMLAIFEPPAP